MLKKIISGGQTGVDQAALDAAIKAGLDHGGWIPKEMATRRQSSTIYRHCLTNSIELRRGKPFGIPLPSEKI